MLVLQPFLVFMSRVVILKPACLAGLKASVPSDRPKSTVCVCVFFCAASPARTSVVGDNFEVMTYHSVSNLAAFGLNITVPVSACYVSDRRGIEHASPTYHAACKDY